MITRQPTQPMQPTQPTQPMRSTQLPAWRARLPHWAPRFPVEIEGLPRWTLCLFLITVPGSTLIVPIVLWWHHRRRQAQWSESMNDADTLHPDFSVAPLVERASRGWNRSLRPFFEPLLDWIAEGARKPVAPQGCEPEPGAGRSDDH